MKYRNLSHIVLLFVGVVLAGCSNDETLQTGNRQDKVAALPPRSHSQPKRT